MPGKKHSKEEILEMLAEEMQPKHYELALLMAKHERNVKAVCKEMNYVENSVRTIWKNYPLVKIVVALKELDNEKSARQMAETPTLEWNLNQLMILYQDYQERFDRVKDDKSIANYDQVENIKKQMQSLLKQITEFQAKYGQKLDDDILKISKMSDEELASELKRLTYECDKYLKKPKWYDKAYKKRMIKEEGNEEESKIEEEAEVLE